jgi:hypothetical protein
MAIVIILVAFLGLLAWNIGRKPEMIVDGAKVFASARTGGIAA